MDLRRCYKIGDIGIRVVVKVKEKAFLFISFRDALLRQGLRCCHQRRNTQCQDNESEGGCDFCFNYNWISILIDRPADGCVACN